MIFLDENGSRLEARGTGFNVKNVILSVAKNPGRVFLIAVLVAACASFAAKKKDAEEQARIQDSLKQVEIQNLQREIESLARIRLQKADSLEKLEAAHWSKRYAESQLTEEHQVETRELDGRYTKLSTDLGRVSEEVQAGKDVTAEAEETAKAEEDAFEAFNTQVRLSIDKSLDEITGDYPVGMGERLLSLNKAQREMAKKKPNTLPALRYYLNDLLVRQEMTYTQSFGPEKSQVGSRTDVEVYRMRLGTVFLGEAATDNGEIQALLRTGALQGKRYEWNSTLPADMAESIRAAINNAYSGLSKSNTVQVDVPMDLLQNKAIKNSISNKGDSLTVIFVNRAENNPQDVYLSLDGFKAENTANALTLSGIAGETFVSHTSNGLKKNAVNVKMTGGMTNATENYANKFAMTLPAKSITAVLFTTKNPTVIDAIAPVAARSNYSLTLQGREILVSGIQQNSRYALTNTLGQVIRSGLWNGAAGATLRLSVPATGRYILQIGGKSQMVVVNK